MWEIFIFVAFAVGGGRAGARCGRFSFFSRRLRLAAVGRAFFYFFAAFVDGGGGPSIQALDAPAI